MAVGQSGWDKFWNGADYQIGQDYTSGQQGLANTAWGNAATAVNSWKPNQDAFTQYQQYLKTINPGQLFANASKPGQYEPFVNASMSDAGTAYKDLAAAQGTEAANSAASQFNLQNGLFSGAAAQAIAQGAAKPQYDANVSLANLKSSLMSTLLGQNLNSQMQELGLQSAGQAGLFQGYQNQDQMKLNQALGLGNVYSNQAGSYDTQAMFGSGTGLLDIINALMGGAAAGKSLFGNTKSPVGTTTPGSFDASGGFSGTGFGGTNVTFIPSLS